METHLRLLQVHVNVLDIEDAPLPGRKGRTSKTDRLKAVMAIHDLLGKKGTVSALTAASKYEMVTGPPEDTDSPDNFLGWAGLVRVLFITLRDACEDALNTKAATTSGNATIKPDYMRCFRRAAMLAINDGPPSVISPVAPAFLVFAHDCLGEPALRKIIADELWQCVRLLMQPGANRAVLTPPIIRAWIDNCFQQLTMRGPIVHSSATATSLAGDVLQLFATHVDSYDVLSQSTRGIAPSKMLGGDFGYAIICERACLMLVVADNVTRRHARDLQRVALQTLAIALSDHALDFVASSAVASIIRTALKPILSCWIERKCHDAAVSLARILLLIAPNHSKLHDEIRRRIRADVADLTSSAVLRAGQDVRDDYIDAAASCFSFREALEFASASDAVQGHIIIWLRVAFAIISGRVLKRGTSILIDAKDLFDQCNRSAEAVCCVITSQCKVRGNYFAEIIRCACDVVNSSAVIANRILTAGLLSSRNNTPWSQLFFALRELATTLAYTGRTPGYSMSAAGPNPEERLMESLTYLCEFGLVDYGTLETSLLVKTPGSSDLPFPLSRIMSSPVRSSVLLDLQFLHNLVSRTGLSDEDGTGLRYRVVLALTKFCSEESIVTTSPEILVHASAVAIALTRGESLSPAGESFPSKVLKGRAPLSPSLSALFRVQLLFAHSGDSSKISGKGPSLVQSIREQDIIYCDQILCSVFTDELPSMRSFLSPIPLAVDSVDSHLTLSKHFSVDVTLSAKLENQILLHLTVVTDESLKDVGSVDGTISDPHARWRFVDQKSMNVGLSVLVFACNYLSIGLRCGSIIVTESVAEDQNSNEKLAMLVCKVVSALRNVDVVLLEGSSDLTKTCLTACCGFFKVLESENVKKSFAENSPWKLAWRVIADEMTKLSSSLCDFLMVRMLQTTKLNRDRIRAYLNRQLEGPGPEVYARGKRRRTTPNIRNSRKRPRTVFSSSESNELSGNDEFPSSDREQSIVEENDSDDDFWIGISDSNKTRVIVGNGSYVADEIRLISDYLIVLVKGLPNVREVVLECCKNGLKAVGVVERVLSPDGFERASLYSPLVDLSAIQVRSRVWDVLFHFATLPSILVAADDILNVFKYWKNLETISQEYATFYHFLMSNDAKKRTHFPLPLELENARILFLDNARRFFNLLELTIPSQVSDISLFADQVQKTLSGFIDIAEFFRMKHAFRMPRLVRFFYLQFGQEAICLRNIGLFREATSATQGSDKTSLSERISNIQGALCKLLNDSEAMVRMEAAKAVSQALGSWERFRVTDIEQIFDESLPPVGFCVDSNPVFIPRQGDADINDNLEEPNELGLKKREAQALSCLQVSFQKIGANSRGLSALASLGEISAAREDAVPFFFKQVSSRVKAQKNLFHSAFSVIVRLCCAYSLRSPQHFYRVFSRAILPRILACPLAIESLLSFPVALVIDENHYDDGVLFDWLRDEQAELLPHLLAHDDAPSLPITTRFAESIGLELREMLLNNPGAVVRVFPMLFSPTFKVRGEKLWRSINIFFDGKVMVELAKQKDEVIQGLLLSASANFNCRCMSRDRSFNVELCKGFSRDTDALNPPFYDPLIIAVTINHLYTSTSEASILPSHVLCGSIFEQLRSEQSGAVIVDKFPGFVKECRRQNTSILLKGLLMIWKALDPALTCQTTFNRLDAFFCVGMFWLMLGPELLAKGTHERLLFYKLVSLGFHHVETASDAAWLLLKIQNVLSTIKDQYKSFSLSIEELTVHPLDGAHLTCLNTLEDKVFYELLNAFSPTLVCIISEDTNCSSSSLHDNARDSLRRLLSVCVDKGLWNAIICNGPFPSSKSFKEARNVYGQAVKKIESMPGNENLLRIVSSLRMFRGICHLRRKSRINTSCLSSLQELSALLSGANLSNLSNRIASEAWLKSSGEKQPTSSLVSSCLATLIELLRSPGNRHIKSCSAHKDPFERSSNSLFELCFEMGPGKDAIFVISDVLNSLGLINQYSTPFIHLDVHGRSIPAKHTFGKYEDILSGIVRSVYSLMDTFQSDSSIAAESAIISLALMQNSSDGKSVFSSKEKFSSLNYVRVERKGTLAGLSLFDSIVLDPRNGDRVLLSSLASIDDPILWGITGSMASENGDFQPWMRRLCTVLSLRCGSDANKSLAGACFASFQLSCDVLPYLLMDIVCDLRPQALVNLSSLMLEHVFRNAETPLSILRVFVHVLDVLCQIGLGIVHIQGFTSFIQKTPSGSPFVPYLYVLDVPYADAIKASLRCGESFSAIRYCHLYVDHKIMTKEIDHGKRGGTLNESTLERRYSSCPDRDLSIVETERGALQKVKSWVREAMNQLFETDVIRAFAYSDRLSETSVNISSLDEEWFKSLASLGVAAQVESYEHPNVIPSCTPSTENIRGVDLLQAHRTFRSLLGIGNVHVATQYWDGLVNRVTQNGLRDPSDPIFSNQELIEKMNDLRYAAAWKLECWESPVLLGQNSLGDFEFPQFHQAVHRVLYLLKTGRLSESPPIFLSARRRLLRDLCHCSSSVSAGQILEVAAQLRILHFLEDSNCTTVQIGTMGITTSEKAQQQEGIATLSLVGSQRYHSTNSGEVIENILKGLKDVLVYPNITENVRDVRPSPQSIFNANILAEDLPLVFVKCAGLVQHVAQFAVSVSSQILRQGGSGSWARSACSLGTPASTFVTHAPELDKVAWNIQECELRWSGSDDARTRKHALTKIKDIIFGELGGQASEPSIESCNSSSPLDGQQVLTWSDDNHRCTQKAFLRSEACRLAAIWSLDMRTHEPLDLFQTYLESALSAVFSSNDPSLLARAHHAMARFADIQIENIDAYRRSRKFEEMVLSINETEEDISRLKKMKEEQATLPKSSRKRSRLSSAETSGVDKVVADIGYFIHVNSKQISLDKGRLEKLDETYKRWQVLACEHYAASLRHGSTNDLHSAFRMVALWLDSGDMRNSITHSLTKQENNNRGSNLNIQVPVEKLLPLAPQLFSRLDFSEKSAFQNALCSTIICMSGKHPAHCLWPLLALTNAQRTSGTEEERLSSLYRGNKDKKDAAVDILRRLEVSHGETVSEMKMVADAYIALSEISGKQKKNGSKLDISRSLLMRLGPLVHVSVPTVPLPIYSSSYSNGLPTIAGFDKTARVCAGLSKPLKIKCLGSDGVLYAQMVKGRDDLRGDAVMEQLFSIMNTLLEHDIQASKRNLHIRTYRIVPLSPFSGIMQFVSNTMQFKELLVEGQEAPVVSNARGRRGQPGHVEGDCIQRGSLHERYRPRDLKNITIAERAFDEYKKKYTLQRRLNYLRVVWKRFQPVFRYFFLEEWPDASDWFTHQLAYSHSTAVISIVGFILGLGDRHLSNILVDVHTAEVVHIDFGIAFEQGKILPVPEHMPFRLTRDLVDGFGISGVEGVFRKCCEITLSVMRKYKDVLLTVVEVLLHDPMFNWALTPEEVLREQLDPNRNLNNSVDDAFSPDDSCIEDIALNVKRNRKENGSREAHRALHRISEKLDGLEGTERLSVEAHVARLIDEAQAFHVIAPVYPGWAPWL